MRALVGGIVGAVALASALWVAVAGATPPSNGGGPYQIYIFNDADQPSVHLYAFSVGQLATAAQVENCVGRLVDNPHQIVADLRARLRNHDDRFSVVWVEGRGSSTHVGGCDPHDHEEDVDPESEGEPTDSLVVVRDASASQARQLIRELHGLSREDRQAMIDALGLDRRARARL